MLELYALPQLPSLKLSSSKVGRYNISATMAEITWTEG
jgi:hypothetical protein